MTTLVRGEAAGEREPLRLIIGKQMPAEVATGENSLQSFFIYDVHSVVSILW